MTYNKKQIGPVLIFIAWLIGIAVVCIVGISNVFALEYKNISSMTDKTDMTIEVSYETESSAPLVVSNGQDVYTQIKVMNIFLSDFSFQANVHYQLEMYFPKLTLTNANQYEVYDQQNNESCSISYKYSIFVEDYPRFNFQCAKNTNSVYIKVYNSSNSNITEMGTFQWQYSYLRYTDTSISTDNTDMSDNIINNDNKNTDKVIDNDNKNTDKIIEANKKNFESCRDSYNLFDEDKFFSMLTKNNGVYSGYSSLPFKTYSSEKGGLGLIFEPNTSYTIEFIAKASTDVTPGTFAVGIKYTDGTSGVMIVQGQDYKTYKAVTGSARSISMVYFTYYSNAEFSIKEFVISKTDNYVGYEKFGQVCKNRLDEQNETSKGILGKIKDILSYINPLSENFFAYKLIELLIDALKSLIVPENFDFINDFKEVLENKLGFIASVPIQLLDYIISLKDKVFTPVTSISFPKISFFGYYFWDDMTIDITQGLNWISAFKYLTDIGCVIIMVNTLRKWYANFTGGDEK